MASRPRRSTSRRTRGFCSSAAATGRPSSTFSLGSANARASSRSPVRSARARARWELDDGYATALILNPVMTPIQLMRSILRELDLKATGNDRVRLVERLNEFLLDRAHANVAVVLFIDEAQDMSDGSC